MGALVHTWYINQGMGAHQEGKLRGGAEAPAGGGRNGASSGGRRRQGTDRVCTAQGTCQGPLGVTGIPALCSRGCCVKPGQPSRTRLGKGVLQGSRHREHCAGRGKSWRLGTPPPAGARRDVGTRRRQRG